MKRNDWLQDRAYDPTMVDKPWWSEFEEISLNDPQYKKLIEEMLALEKTGGIVNNWKPNNDTDKSTPKLKSK
jgi:hypothetical protein